MSGISPSGIGSRSIGLVSRNVLRNPGILGEQRKTGVTSIFRNISFQARQRGLANSIFDLQKHGSAQGALATAQARASGSATRFLIQQGLGVNVDRQA